MQVNSEYMSIKVYCNLILHSIIFDIKKNFEHNRNIKYESKLLLLFSLPL